MDTMLRALRIEHLRARVELCRIACAALEREYYAGGRSVREMADIARRWGDALKLGNAARMELDRLGVE